MLMFIEWIYICKIKIFICDKMKVKNEVLKFCLVNDNIKVCFNILVLICKLNLRYWFSYIYKLVVCSSD